MARAFVPGHVTGFFSVHRHAEPRRAGSRGAGLCLSDGVRVAVESAAETEVRLNGRSASIGAVQNVVEELDVTVRIECETSLPVSAGFGVSGACALGTALAVDAELADPDDAAAPDPLAENALVSVAHAAEIRAGTGLGDVVGQARGGVPIRLEPGAPGHGRLDGLPTRPRVEYVSFGELDTTEVIGGDTDRISAAGEVALGELESEPTLDRFVRASRTFARDAGLLTDRVAEAIDAVEAAGGRASMVMLGRTVFALGNGLSAAGYDATTCRITGGASLVEE